MKKDTLRTGVKIALGLLVVVYVLRSKMVDFEAVRTVLWNPINLLLGFLFLGLSVVLSAARWRLLVRAQGLSLSFGHLVELTLIGNFFNTFMPGSVGGDLIKAWYVAGREPARRTLAVFTVLLDRALGLTVILFYSAFTLLFYTEWLANRPQLKVIATSIWGFTAVSLALAVVFFSSRAWSTGQQNRLLRFLHRSRRIGILVDATLLYRHHFLAIVAAFTFSALSILGMIVLYQWLGRAIGIDMAFAQYLFLIPLAMTATAIPLLPGGIGVGQVAFFTLFKWMGVPEPDHGGALCTLLQIYTMLFSLLGLIPYLRYKRSPVGNAVAKSVEAAVN